MGRGVEEFCEQVIGHPADGFESIRRGAILLRAARIAELTQSEARAADLKRSGHRGADRNVVVDELRRQEAWQRDGNKVTADALQRDGNKCASGMFIDDIKGGNNTSYLKARLKRDAPKILSRLQAGEFRSVRAAAIEAGIVKPATPLTLLMRAWRRASPQEREKFLLWTEEAARPVLNTVGGK